LRLPWGEGLGQFEDNLPGRNCMGAGRMECPAPVPLIHPAIDPGPHRRSWKHNRAWPLGAREPPTRWSN